jgi:hypothetical protein
MNTRRNFLRASDKGSAMALATALLSKIASASNASSMNGSYSMEPAVSNSNQGHYIPPFKFGMGGVPLGIDHKNALDQVFPAAKAKNVSFVVGSSLNAGFVSGSPRYNYGKESYKIHAAFLEKRKRLREVASVHGVDLRTAALQFSIAPDIVAALVVGASSEQQILADYTSMQTKIPAELWEELSAHDLIEQNAPVPALSGGACDLQILNTKGTVL